MPSSDEATAPVGEQPDASPSTDPTIDASRPGPDNGATAISGQEILDGEAQADADGLLEFLTTPGLAEWAQWASTAGLDWTKLRHDWKSARLVADAAKQQASHEFELEREKLQNQADQAQAEVARSNQIHAAELEKIRLESRLRYQNDRVRSTVLLLVVLALVLMPVVAMLGPGRPIAPEEFTQYIAPIVGIAGTVLGYWFGKQETSS